MKIFYYYLIIAIFAVWQIHAEDLKAWGAITNDFQMSIRIQGDKNEVKTNQPCILTICYRNISTNEIFWVYERNGIEHDPDYSFQVISPSGKDISPDMKHIRHGDSGGNIPVPPSKSIQIKFNLSELCKLDEVGTYKIIAEKRGVFLLEKRKSFTVVSNPLYVSVVPN